MKKIKLNIVLVSLVILYLFLIWLPEGLGRGNDVIINNLGKKSELSTGDFVYIAYISINDEKIPINKLNISGTYSCGEDGYSLVIENGNKVVMTTKNFDRIEIAIEKTQDSGYVSLTDGKRTRKINLVSTGERMYYHPEITKIQYWIILVAVLIMIYIFIYFVVQKVDIWLGERKNKIFLKMDSFWLVVSCIITRLYYWRYFPDWFVISPDTDSYVRYLTTDIRTPLYPAVINFVQLFTDDVNLVYKGVVLIQSILGIISVLLFYRIISGLTTKRKVRLVLTFAFANLPMFIFYEHYIMTESISLFLTLCIIRTVQIYILKPSKIYGFIVAILCTLLFLQRPAALYVIPLLIVFYLLHYFIERKKQDVIALAFLCIPIVVYMGYCMINFSNSGRFEISYVPTVYNQGIDLTNGNIYDNPNYEDISETVSEYKMQYGVSHWSYVWQIFGQYGTEYSSYIKDTGKYNARELSLIRIKRFVNQWDSKITESNISRNIYSSNNPQMIRIDDGGLDVERIFNFLFMPITIGQVCILILFCMGYYLYLWFRNHYVPWLQLGLSSMMLCILLVSFWKADSDFIRLMITILPIIYLVFADILERININCIIEK